MTFQALVVDRLGDGSTRAAVRPARDSELPEGEVTLEVSHSTLNYKDGLCLGSGGGLVRHYPHVPGVDCVGTVRASTSNDWEKGQKVIVTGWRFGETRWGGYAGRARVLSGWPVPLPQGLDPGEAMALGTPGLTALLAIAALEREGLRPGSGPVLVTGASGGVGSLGVVLLAALGYEVAAVTGRMAEEPWLRSLGAARVLDRSLLAEATEKPLESETWAGAIDMAGGPVLARLLGQMRAGSAVAAVGLAGGARFQASIVPFLLRGIRLIGIDSVMAPPTVRREIWRRLAGLAPSLGLARLTSRAVLGELPHLGSEILKGRIRGRVVVNIG